MKKLLAGLIAVSALWVAAPAQAHNIYRYWGCPGNTAGTSFCDSNVTANEAIWETSGTLNSYNEGGGNWRVIGRYGPAAVKVRQTYWNLGHDCWVEWHTVPYGYQVTCSWATGP